MQCSPLHALQQALRLRHAAGESYLLLDRSLQALIQHIARPVLNQIRLSWPVSGVSQPLQADAPVLVHGPRGEQLACRRLIVAVPLPVLQRRQLTFSPPLPQRKQEAIARLRMGNAVKVGNQLCLWPAARSLQLAPAVRVDACAHCCLLIKCILHRSCWRFGTASGLQSCLTWSAPTASSLSSGAPATLCQAAILSSSSQQPAAAGAAVALQSLPACLLLDRRQAASSAGPLFSAEPELPTALQSDRWSSGGAEPQSAIQDGQTSTAEHASSPAQDSSSLHGLIGFVCGRKADAAAALGHQGAVDRALQQLDAMYGEPYCSALLARTTSLVTIGAAACWLRIFAAVFMTPVSNAGTPRNQHPASSSLVRAHVVNWAEQPYIWGAYSHPSLGAHPGDR